MLPEHMDVGWFDCPAWWGPWGWLMPLLLVTILAIVAVWAIARITRERPVAGAPAPPAMPGSPVATSDPALERARIRYASGDLSREDYLRLARDLGAPVETQVVEIQQEGTDG